MNNLIEGYYIMLNNHVILYVKGNDHPEGKVIAFPKYVPDSHGDRSSKWNVKYKKLLTISEQLSYVKEKLPQYLTYDLYLDTKIPEIPTKDIKKIFNPIERSREILHDATDDVEKDCREFISKLLHIANSDEIGISGSILIKLHRESSDIDLVIYSSMERLWRIYNELESLRHNNVIRSIDKYHLKENYMLKHVETPIDFSTFKLIESKKLLDGIFNNRRYFIRLVRYPIENNYGKTICRKLGWSVVKVEILDDYESILTPCRYKVRVLEFLDGIRKNIVELYSHRGRFCELTRVSRKFIVKGIVEKVVNRDKDTQYFRLYLGYSGSFAIPIISE